MGAMEQLTARFSQLTETLSRPNPFAILAAILGLFLFALSLLRAAGTGMTYDEAFTYLFYVLPTSHSGAHPQWLNNHLLNTYLIKLFDALTHTRYNELVIRLPNLLAYPLYLLSAALLTAKFRQKLLILVLFFCNYYLHEFFGLARGYALATAFVAAGLVFCLRWHQDDLSEGFSWLDAAVGCFCLAALANAISLYVAASVLGLEFVRLWRKSRFVAFVWRKRVLLPAAIFLFTVSFTFWVSQKGRPIFFGTEFYTSIPASFATMFFASSRAGAMAVVLVAAGGVFTLWRRRLRTPWIGRFGLYLFLAVCSAFLFGRGYPTQRELLPAYPLLVLAVGEIVDTVTEAWPRLTLVFPVAAFCLLALFMGRIDLNATHDWRDNYAIKRDITQAMASGILSFPALEQKYPGQPVVTFYSGKINFLKQVAP